MNSNFVLAIVFCFSGLLFAVHPLDVELEAALQRQEFFRASQIALQISNDYEVTNLELARQYHEAAEIYHSMGSSMGRANDMERWLEEATVDSDDESESDQGVSDSNPTSSEEASEAEENDPTLLDLVNEVVAGESDIPSMSNGLSALLQYLFGDELRIYDPEYETNYVRHSPDGFSAFRRVMRIFRGIGHRFANLQDVMEAGVAILMEHTREGLQAFLTQIRIIGDWIPYRRLPNAYHELGMHDVAEEIAAVLNEIRADLALVYARPAVGGACGRAF